MDGKNAGRRLLRGQASIRLRTRYLVSLPKEPALDRLYPLVVAFHGMGEDGAGFAELLRGLESDERILLFPDAPLPRETKTDDGRREGFAWYIYTGDQAAFLASVERTETYILSLIDRIIDTQPVDPERVALLGYSQGGYFAGIMALRHPGRFRGLASACCRLKHEILPEGDADTPPPSLPILAVHGARDRHIPIDAARDSAESLRALGLDVDFRVFPSGHGFSSRQIAEVGVWLNERGL